MTDNLDEKIASLAEIYGLDKIIRSAVRMKAYQTGSLNPRALGINSRALGLSARQLRLVRGDK